MVKYRTCGFTIIPAATGAADGGYKNGEEHHSKGKGLLSVVFGHY